MKIKIIYAYKNNVYMSILIFMYVSMCILGLLIIKGLRQYVACSKYLNDGGGNDDAWWAKRQEGSLLSSLKEFMYEIFF